MIGHFNNTVVTVQVNFGITDWLHETPARQLTQITSLTILEHAFTRSLQWPLSWKFSCPWWQQVTTSQMF